MSEKITKRVKDARQYNSDREPIGPVIEHDEPDYERMKQIDDYEKRASEAEARWTAKRNKHADAGGNYRDLEGYAIKTKDADYEHGSHGGDPDLYYERKYKTKPGEFSDMTRGANTTSEMFETAVHSVRGRQILRDMIKRAEADSAKVANEKAKKAQEHLFSGEAFKEKKDE